MLRRELPGPFQLGVAVWLMPEGDKLEVPFTFNNAGEGEPPPEEHRAAIAALVLMGGNCSRD